MSVVTLSYLQSEIRNLRATLEERARNIAREAITLAFARFVLKSRMGKRTTAGRAVQGRTNDPNERPVKDKNPLVHLAESFENPEGGDPREDEAEAIEAAGFAVVPLPGQPCWVFNLGPKTAVIPTASEAYRPADLDHGDAAMYSLAREQARVTVRADGTVEIGSFQNAPPPKRKPVVVNGGTLKVARQTDKVAASPELAAWIAAVNTALTALSTGKPATPPTTAPTEIGTISGPCAEFFKA